MFKNRSDLLIHNPPQLSYGLAITDFDGDGLFEVIVAGFGYPNLVLKWDGTGLIDVAPPALADVNRQAIGVAAGDFDGDGMEEIYILNTDTFGGVKRLGDRLFDFVDGEWVDLFSVPAYQQAVNLIAGRSVAVVDRLGTGQYGFFVANYGGPMCFYELDADGRLQDIAPLLGLNLVAGGRSLIALPLVSDYMDIFIGNEHSPNFLFRNIGNGRYEEIAQQVGISDPAEHVRGVTVVDYDAERFAVAYGNWQGPHRLFVPTDDAMFVDTAPFAMAKPSAVRTVIAADFDNDGYEELFFNNIGQPNRLFAQRDGAWQAISLGEASEPDGLGTGAAVGDFDRDGRLELLIAHGESGMQPLSLYRVPENGNNWIRVLPYTAQGAPARGTIVKIVAGDRIQRRVIDAGSGYLCQMEPIAHFGLGHVDRVESVEVIYPDRTRVTLEAPPINTLLKVEHPRTLRF